MNAFGDEAPESGTVLRRSRAAGDDLAGDDLAEAAFLTGLVRRLLLASPNAVVVVDRSGSIRFANDRLVEVFGFEPTEVLGKPVELILPDYLAEREASNLVGLRGDGTEFPVEVSRTSVDWEQETWTIVTVTDVSARRESEGRVQDLSRAYLTLAKMNQAIVRAPDVANLHAATCQIAVEQGGYLGAWVAEPTPDGVLGVLASAGPLDEYLNQLRIPQADGEPTGCALTSASLRDGRPRYTVDFQSEPATAPWHLLAEKYGVNSSATLPLYRGGDTVAVVTLYSAVPNAFDAQVRVLLEGLARNVSYALDGFQAEDQLRRVAKHRSELMRRLAAGQEQERARIAADVHDDAIQALAALDLRLGLLRRKVRETSPQLVDLVDQVQGTLTGATRSLRGLLYDLEPTDADVSLVDAVKEAAAFIFETSDISWSVDADPVIDLSYPERQQAVRIAKEALRNACHHARPTSVIVTLRAAAGGIDLAIADDGVGVDLDTVTSPPGHRGLTTMNDRAEVAGGWCRLEHTPGGGTTVRCWLPGSLPG
jgi:PAS domain S-box-containing protein